MKREILSTGQLQDASGSVREAARNFDSLGFEDDIRVPRPALSSVIQLLATHGLTLRQPQPGGSIFLSPKESVATEKLVGLRGIAHYRANGASKVAPAIVLRDGKRVGMLIAETNPGEINELKHSLLENIYATQKPDIVAHGTANAVAPTVGGHALIAASFIGDPRMAHDRVHDLADAGNFGAAFDGAGSRDITFGAAKHDVLKVRSAVLPLGQVVLEVSEAFQLQQESLFGGGMNAGELNVAMTVAATLSRAPWLDLRGNMEAMKGQ